MTAWNDERVESLMGRLLQAGVLASALVVAAGATWYLIRHGGEPAAYHTFKGEPQEFRSLGGVIRGLRGPHSARALIQLGLLMLIATPIARVAFSVFAFARQHDRAYVLVTLIVLAILIFSLAGGVTV